MGHWHDVDKLCKDKTLPPVGVTTPPATEMQVSAWFGVAEGLTVFVFRTVALVVIFRNVPHIQGLVLKASPATSEEVAWRRQAVC